MSKPRDPTDRINSTLKLQKEPHIASAIGAVHLFVCAADLSGCNQSVGCLVSC